MAIIKGRQAASGCSVGGATSVELDGGIFDLADATFAVTTVPTGAGTGTLNVEFSTYAAPTTFVQAKLSDGSDLTCDLSKVDVFTIEGIDIHSLKFTPSGISGVTSYAYSISANGS